MASDTYKAMKEGGISKGIPSVAGQFMGASLVIGGGVKGISATRSMALNKVSGILPKNFPKPNIDFQKWGRSRLIEGEVKTPVTTSQTYYEYGYKGMIGDIPQKPYFVSSEGAPAVFKFIQSVRARYNPDIRGAFGDMKLPSVNLNPKSLVRVAETPRPIRSTPYFEYGFKELIGSIPERRLTGYIGRETPFYQNILAIKSRFHPDIRGAFGDMTLPKINLNPKNLIPIKDAVKTPRPTAYYEHGFKELIGTIPERRLTGFIGKETPFYQNIRAIKNRYKPNIRGAFGDMKMPSVKKAVLNWRIGRYIEKAIPRTELLNRLDVLTSKDIHPELRAAHVAQEAGLAISPRQRAVLFKYQQKLSVIKKPVVMKDSMAKLKATWKAREIEYGKESKKSQIGGGGRNQQMQITKQMQKQIETVKNPSSVFKLSPLRYFALATESTLSQQKSISKNAYQKLINLNFNREQQRFTQASKNAEALTSGLMSRQSFVSLSAQSSKSAEALMSKPLSQSRSVFRQIQSSRPFEMQKQKRLQLPKSISAFTKVRKKRFKKPRFGKFPELARVATARQVWGRL